MKESQRWILSSLVTMICVSRLSKAAETHMSPSCRLALNCTPAPEHLANVEVEQRDAIKRVRYFCSWRHSSCRTIQELSKLFPFVCLRPCNCMSCMFDIQKNTWHFEGAPDEYEWMMVTHCHCITSGEGSDAMRVKCYEMLIQRGKAKRQ